MSVSVLDEDFRDRDVCIVGLGYVGLTLAIAMAEAGFRVTGTEVRTEVLESLQAGRAPFFEPGLEQRLMRNLEEGRFRVFARIPEDCGARVFILTVGTPLGPDGRVRLDMIRRAAHEVRERFGPGALVIARSTVKVGTTRKFVAPILDEAGIDYDLAFCPERTVEGQALQELPVLPQIVGGVTPRACLRASQLFQNLTATVVRVRDLETAEMIKLVDNTQRDMIFAYSNEIARLCDGMGISASEVIASGKLGYPRHHLFKPGPVGGPCLSKDSHILLESGAEYGVEAEITRAARLLNERQPEEVAAWLGKACAVAGIPAAAEVAVCGLAFKGRPPTDDLRGTPAIPLIAGLKRAFPEARLRGYDAMVAAAEIAGLGLSPCATLEEAFAGSHLVVLQNNHPQFAAMDLAGLARAMARPAMVYDFWNNFQAHDLRLPEGVSYAALGSHGLLQMPTAR
ncbi:MAG: nucleotide sugar dehydrogenase [Rhodospirillaceae bacterium]